ncbi:MAG: DUF2194 domain-containing protein [Clostridia bacterium]|nr:DUF2194 domain-containing protein [Clostridia bacterium]
MRQQRHAILYITTPVLCLVLGFALIVSQSGMPMEARPLRLEALAPTAQNTQAAGFDVLVLRQEESPLLDTVCDTLKQMRLGYQVSGTLDAASLGRFRTVLVCSSALTALEGEGAVTLMNWVAEGGHLALMSVPSVDSWLPIVSHKLGIMDGGKEYREYGSLRPAPGAMDVFGGLVMDEELSDYALSLRLEGDCRVLMTTADAAQTPLLWTREIGRGRVAVCNHTLIGGKDSRGHVVMTLRALEGVLVYPIVNAGMIFIDDFPAPQPEGFDEMLQSQYGMSIQGFFRNHWWPDMKALARRFGLRYTGVLVETYNRQMEPPFLPDSEDHGLIRYYASELLQSGGEVGLHGYNHQPLCLDGWQYAGEDYETWASEENMAMAVEALARYGRSFLPEAVFTSYVPPSNYLSPEGQRVLLRTVPDLAVISGLYLPEDGVNALVQEFREETDGSISVPRITSGFSMDSYLKLVASGELALHGVFSHFIHPDDVLDVERGAMQGWEGMRNDFTASLEEITAAYPALRWCTASEAAAAVQRYDRLGVERQWENGALTLHLDAFYDEAWLCLSADRAPSRVSGAECYPAGSGCLWLRAVQDTVRLEWEDGR